MDQAGQHNATATAEPRRITPPLVSSLQTALSRAGGPQDRDRLVENFFDDIRRVGTPLIEPAVGEPAHRDVTFLWRGDPDTERVLLSMSGLPRDEPAAGLLDHISGTDIWYAGYRLRSDFRSSYRICELAPDEPLEDRRRLQLFGGPDPFNTCRLAGRWSQPASSIVALADAPADPWLHPFGRVTGPTGSLVKHQVESHRLGCERDVWIYRPPAAEQVTRDGQPLPVLVLCDGDRWFDELDLHTVLDSMITNGLLPPVQVLAPAAVDLETRWRELRAHDPFVEFLAEELLPWARQRWSLTEDPARTVIGGQSLGGLTALYAALRRPETFGLVLGQSASLWWRPGLADGLPHPDDVGRCWLAEQFAGADRLPSAVHLQAGLHEGRMIDLADEVAAELRRRDVPVTTTAFNGGHDYAWWRGGLFDGLGALLSR